METNDPILLELARRIALEPDVESVLELSRSGDRFDYLLATNYFAYPRYIIGSTDDDAADVRRNHLFGSEGEARAKWGELAAEHLPA